MSRTERNARVAEMLNLAQNFTPDRRTFVEGFRDTGGFAELPELIRTGVVGRRFSAMADHRTYLGVPINPRTGEREEGFVLLAPPTHSTLLLGPSDAGKTESYIVPNAFLSKSPTIITSARPDVFLKAAETLIARGERVMLYDPTGTLAKGSRRKLKEMGVTPATWSIFDSNDGTNDWVKNTAENMVATSTVDKDHGDVQEYWRLWTIGWLEQIVRIAANASPEQLREENVLSKTEYLLKLRHVNPENAKVITQDLQDRMQHLIGRQQAVDGFAHVIRGVTGEAAVQTALATHIAATREQFADVSSKAERTFAEYTAAKQGQRASGDTAAVVEPASGTGQDLPIAEAETVIVAGTLPGEPVKPGELTRLNVRAHELKQRSLQLAGQVDQLTVMAQAEDGLAAEDIPEVKEDIHNEIRLAEDQMEDIKQILSLASTPVRADGKTSPSVAFGQMAKQVIEPWRNASTLKSANTGSGRPVFDPEDLFQNGGKLFIYMPPGKANKFAPITNLLLTTAAQVAIEHHDTGNLFDDIPTLLLDEAMQVAKIAKFGKLVAVLRESARLLTVAQLSSMLQEEYGTEGRQSIETNHQVIVYMTHAGNMEDLDRFADMVGHHEVEASTRTWSERGGVGESRGKSQELYLRGSELRKLPKHTAVVSIDSHMVYVDLQTSEKMEINKNENEYNMLPALVKELKERSANQYWESREITADAMALSLEAVGLINQALNDVQSRTGINDQLLAFFQDRRIRTSEEAIDTLSVLRTQIQTVGLEAATILGFSPDDIQTNFTELVTTTLPV